jgi:cell volume regulation protein A
MERFHAASASLAETVAFVVLGLSVDLGALTHSDVWVPGVVLGAALAFQIRPLLVDACLLPVQLQGNERVFVPAAGPKAPCRSFSMTYCGPRMCRTRSGGAMSQG